jgi:hypothetical protein
VEIFHDFRFSWYMAIKQALNRELQPPDYYAIADQATRGVAVCHSSGDRVVAMVEIDSPGNKASRHAMKAFVDKSIELLDAGIHLLLMDLFPPGPRDPQGIHAALWEEYVGDAFQLPLETPLTLVSYSAGLVKQAFIEPVAVGATLPEMPLFLEPERYVQVPLESAYQTAFAAVPQRWRTVLAPPAG